ncbi:hypothetical protein V6N13_074075 [Hibiscus sabdariffa]
MKEIKVKDTSPLCTIVPDIEPGIRQPASGSVKSTPEIEKKYGHRVYDAIAPHFSSTRFAKWPKVAAFLESLPTGSLILDAGCGNGKYLDLNSSCYFIGCDISPSLIKICADKGHEVLVADAVNLPYRTNFGDAAISIAVLHHSKEWIGPGCPRLGGPSSLTLESIPETEENGLGGRPKVSRESLTGNMLRSTCSTSQNEDDSLVSEDGRCPQEYFVPWHLPYHRAEVSGASASALANGLAKKDDKKGAVVYNRYYHVFGEGELERLVSGMGNAVIVDKFYDKSNWCIILD